MQFQFNSDYPGIDGSTGETLPSDYNGSDEGNARDPPAFPDVQPLQCARITTRVYHPSRRQVATVQNVLVRILPPPKTTAKQQTQRQRQSRNRISHSTAAATVINDTASATISRRRRPSSQQIATVPRLQASGFPIAMAEDDGDDGDGSMMMNRSETNSSSSRSSSSSDDLASSTSSSDDDDESMGMGIGMDLAEDTNTTRQNHLPDHSELQTHTSVNHASGIIISDNNYNNSSSSSRHNSSHPLPQQQPSTYTTTEDDEEEVVLEEERAYWIQRTIREAIYGRVLLAVILEKRTASSVTSAATPTHTASISATRSGSMDDIHHHKISSTDNADQNVEWQVTSSLCAIKEMSWQHIRKERDRLAEDPVKEVAAMHYLRAWHAMRKRQQRQWQNSSSRMNDNHNKNNRNSNNNGIIQTKVQGNWVSESFISMLETNIMMPLDLLTDERHLYSIMPYCDGGELFERLDVKERFSESEARFWMHQVMNGLDNLQKSGICHRDISLENLLVHNDTGALVIDLGMCLRIPFLNTDNNDVFALQKKGNELLQPQKYQQQQYQSIQPNSFESLLDPSLTTSMKQLSVMNGALNHGNTSTPVQMLQTAATVNSWNEKRRPRALIRPQGTCGKWIYMSPEIYLDKEPFDGYAVDVWAAGVILFLMLTGFPPWERACQTDERFKYMTAGYLVQMLTEWNLGLSGDALDLLQRMLFLDPKDRLSLDQKDIFFCS